jgi:hypothetical protein
MTLSLFQEKGSLLENITPHSNYLLAFALFSLLAFEKFVTKNEWQRVKVILFPLLPQKLSVVLVVPCDSKDILTPNEKQIMFRPRFYIVVVGIF